MSAKKTGSAARSTARSPRNGGSRLAASADAEDLYPRLNFWSPIVVFALVVLLPLIFQPFWLGLMPRACVRCVFMAFTLVTGEGGMLWLCQITFAGVGALDHRATRHGARLAAPARASWPAASSPRRSA